MDAASVLAARFGVSVRQARRYVDQAASTGRRTVPQASVVFTVKLPPTLVTRVRRRAARSGVTISALVAEALTEFLSPEHRRGPRG
jgi:predicted HicB family RNase H-like nuclease